MRRSRAVALLASGCALVVVFCCVMAGSAAASISPASVSTYISEYRGSETGSSTPGAVSMSTGGASVTASAYWSNGAAYVADTGATVAGAQFNLYAGVEYYFQVSGPAYSTVNVSLTASGGASQTGYAGANGYIQWGSVLFGYGGGTPFTVSSASSPAFSGTVSLPITANIEYYVILHTNCTVGGETDSGWAAGSANVWIDPMLTISPTSVSEGYTLTISPDLSPGLPTPAPCTMLLLGPGLIGLAAVRRRSKK